MKTSDRISSQAHSHSLDYMQVRGIVISKVWVPIRDRVNWQVRVVVEDETFDEFWSENENH
jgi:hypothetical protein